MRSFVGGLELIVGLLRSDNQEVRVKLFKVEEVYTFFGVFCADQLCQFTVK